MGRRKQRGTAKIILYLVLIFFSVTALYPFLWLIIQSFKTSQDYLSSSKLALPRKWYAMNYPQTWQAGSFGKLMFNSVIYTAAATIAATLFGFMAGFAFSKLKNRASPFLYGSFVVGILISLQSILIPLFLMIKSAGLYDTRLGVIIPYTGIALPLAVYLGTEYIRGIPDELIESARMDGARYLKIFISVILPMAAPAAVSAALLTVCAAWNEFMLINILSFGDRIKSLPVGIYRFSGTLSADYGKQFT
ncbi:carbohydrate ABC transporter permease, partial [Treponema sp. OttesenSCG-928-L16]|nr:carbohydrate ABC transporter permease [Treponema sp. OttesenSCG-928-L16]